MANKVDKGVFTYPGRMDVVHAWAYLPDMARAMVGLAEKRDTLPRFSSFGFEGYSLTGHEMKAAVERTVGRSLKTATFPWWILRLIGPFNALIYEVIEMRYLWDTPHRLDWEAMAAVLPDFVPTPLEEAFADLLDEAGSADARAAVGVAQSA